MTQDQAWPLYLLNDVCHGEGLSGTRHAQQGLKLHSALQPLTELPDSLGLITRGQVIGCEFEVHQRMEKSG